MIRSLRQPGPIHPHRIDCFSGDAETLRFALQAGVTLNQAVTAPLIEAGFQCGAATFEDVELNPLRYVIPALADDHTHVAYFSAPRLADGPVNVQHANATFGWSNGEPFIHCHAVWAEGGVRRGGHILPPETIVASAGEATAWGFRTFRIDAMPDPETNFTLMQPTGRGTAGSAVVARIKPNEDVVTAVESVARTYGLGDARIRASLGSLVGTRFTGGEQVNDVATEVLVREGTVRDGRAALDLLVVDMHGQVHEGRLQRGANLVCITFELVIEHDDQGRS